METLLGFAVLVGIVWALIKWAEARKNARREEARLREQLRRRPPPERARRPAPKRSPLQLRGDKALFRDLAAREDWLVLDVESTGLQTEDQVIELAVLDARGRVLLEQLVMPSVPVRRKASEVHGLTKRKLAGQPAWPEVHDEVAALLSGRTVVAYNAAFDGRLLQQTAAAYGLKMPKIDWCCAMLAYAAVIGEAHPRRAGEYRWWKLQEALAGEGIEAVNSHRARADAEATRQLVWKMGAPAEALAPGGALAEA